MNNVEYANSKNSVYGKPAKSFPIGTIILKVNENASVKGNFRIVTNGGLVYLDTGYFTKFEDLSQEVRYVEVTEPITISRDKPKYLVETL